MTNRLKNYDHNSEIAMQVVHVVVKEVLFPICLVTRTHRMNAEESRLPVGQILTLKLESLYYLGI